MRWTSRGDVYVLGKAPPTPERRGLANQLVWSVPVPAFGTLVMSPDGELYLFGTFSGAIDIGQGSVASAGGTDLFLVRYDLDGNLLGATTFGGAGDEVANDIAIDELGAVYLAGTSTGDIDFGIGVTHPVSALDVFVAKVAL